MNGKGNNICLMNKIMNIQNVPLFTMQSLIEIYLMFNADARASQSILQMYTQTLVAVCVCVCTEVNWLFGVCFFTFNDNE